MENTKMILEYLKVIIWPGIIFVLILIFKKVIETRLGNIKKATFPGAVIEFSEDLVKQEIKFESILKEKNNTVEKLTKIIAPLLSTDKGALGYRYAEEMQKYADEQKAVESEVHNISYKYWQSISNQESLAFVNEISSSIKQETKKDPKITYWKSYIAFGTSNKDYAWFSPRQTKGMCYIQIYVGSGKINESKIELQNANINKYTIDDVGTISIPSQPNITNNKDIIILIKKLVKYAYNAVSNE